jgi:hypothetical protein
MGCQERKSFDLTIFFLTRSIEPSAVISTFQFRWPKNRHLQQYLMRRSSSLMNLFRVFLRVPEFNLSSIVLFGVSRSWHVSERTSPAGKKLNGYCSDTYNTPVNILLCTCFDCSPISHKSPQQEQPSTGSWWLMSIRWTSRVILRTRAFLPSFVVYFFLFRTRGFQATRTWIGRAFWFLLTVGVGGQALVSFAPTFHSIAWLHRVLTNSPGTSDLRYQIDLSTSGSAFYFIANSHILLTVLSVHISFGLFSKRQHTFSVLLILFELNFNRLPQFSQFHGWWWLFFIRHRYRRKNRECIVPWKRGPPCLHRLEWRKKRFLFLWPGTSAIFRSSPITARKFSGACLFFIL